MTIELEEEEEGIKMKRHKDIFTELKDGKVMSHKFRVIRFPRGVIIFDVKIESFLVCHCLSFLHI